MLAATTLAFILAAAAATAARQPHDRRTGGMPAPRTATNGSSLRRTVAGAQTRPTVSRARFDAMRHLAYVRGRRVRQLKRVLMHRAGVAEAINLACTAYRVSCSLMWSLARCESTLQADPPHNNVNRGLLQFNPGTFARTPYARFDILSPYANALAGGWMLQQGRRGEWAC